MKTVEKEIIDFNNEKVFEKSIENLSKNNNIKKPKLNLKLMAIIAGYFILSGVSLNLILLYKLILKII